MNYEILSDLFQGMLFQRRGETEQGALRTGCSGVAPQWAICQPVGPCGFSVPSIQEHHLYMRGDRNSSESEYTVNRRA